MAIKNKFTIVFLFILAIYSVSALNANAATFVVNDVNDVQDAVAGDGFCATAAAVCTLRAAITESNALAGADIITLPAGTYTIGIAEASDNANANGDFDITTDITINGAGAASTFVEANAAPGVAIGRVFHIRATATANTIVATLDGMTIRNGRYAVNTFGGGIRIDQGTAHNVTLSNLIITGNLNSASGGGIAISGSTTPATVAINNCLITGNGAGSAVAATSANGAGVLINTATTVTITNSTISNNASNNAIAASATSAFGGGIFTAGGTLSISNSTISGNSATISGAGATSSAFAGGIYNQQATLNLTNSTVSGNTVSNSVTSANAFHAGIRILSSTIAAAATITNSTISGNTANGEGGGIVNISGGAANSTVTITGSTISGNTVLSATGVGGGLEQISVSTGLAVMNVTNSTVSGNSAATGAGSYNGGTTATINYNFATIAANTAATSGGGLFQDATGVTNLKNSVVADNTSASGPDIFGTITSQDYNHVEDVTGGTFFVDNGRGRKKSVAEGFFALPNDVTGTDPGLAALANYGGPTQTKLPIINSPLLDTIPNGTNDCGTLVAVDQRAIARPNGAGCDKGAAELTPNAAPASISGRVTTADGRGILNAVVAVSGGNMQQPRFVRTTSFGYFTVEDLAAGETYVLTINSKRYIFSNPSRVITLNDSITDADFTADPQ